MTLLSQLLNANYSIYLLNGVEEVIFVRKQGADYRIITFWVYSLSNAVLYNQDEINFIKEIFAMNLWK